MADRRADLLGPMVPEAARLTALQGAQILFYPTAIGCTRGEKKRLGAHQHAAWETIQRSHAVANGCYVARPTRIGRERLAGGPGIEFWGQSSLPAPRRSCWPKRASTRRKCCWRRSTWRLWTPPARIGPFLRDRRIDALWRPDQAVPGLRPEIMQSGRFLPAARRDCPVAVAGRSRRTPPDMRRPGFRLSRERTLGSALLDGLAGNKQNGRRALNSARRPDSILG